MLKVGYAIALLWIVADGPTTVAPAGETAPMSSLTAGRSDPFGVGCVLTSTPAQIVLNYQIMGCFGGGWRGRLVLEIGEDGTGLVSGDADRAYGWMNIAARRMSPRRVRDFQQAIVRAAQTEEINDGRFWESGRHTASLHYACGSYARGPVEFVSSLSMPQQPYSPARYARARGLESTANDILDFLGGELKSDVGPHGELFCREGLCANRARIGEYWSP